AMPVVIGMRQAGVRPAGYAAFIFAAPVVDPVMIGVLAIIIGPAGAAVYLATAFAAAFLLALIVDAVDMAPHLKPVPALVGSAAPAPLAHPEPGPLSPPSSCAAAAEAPWTGWQTEAKAAWRRAVTLLRGMAWLIAIGVGVGLAIGLLVPTDALAGIAGAHNPLAVPAAAAAGIPLYFGTELFIPIGDALHAKAAGTGAIVALVIAGAGANIPEFALLTKVARGRVVAAFFAYVFVVATAAGLLTELIL
ncbi:MAG: permease, partial [Acidimicrobiaceae bacterium]|nr:permease [Acidimicrobiaceae bacterium]